LRSGGLGKPLRSSERACEEIDHSVVPAKAGTQLSSQNALGLSGILRSDWIPAYERVKKSPHPLIPADAGIQTLPELPAFRVGQRLLGWTAPYGIDVPE
jgi:hypothetical protein